jgi:hypothetical protein
VSGDDQQWEQARRGLRAWAGFPADRVLDPGTSQQAWPPQGLDEQQVSWGHSTAVIGADGRTVTLRFIFGSGYADCPSVEVLETGGAVAVVPAEVDIGPPGFRAMPARPREVTVVLTRPLGARVLLDGLGLPVMVLRRLLCRHVKLALKSADRYLTSVLNAATPPTGRGCPRSLGRNSAENSARA